MSTKKNICRPIIIYDKLMPQNEEPTIKMDYVILGVYDGIIVGQPLKVDYEDIIKNLQDETKKLDGSYNPQILHCFRREYSQNSWDEEFWDKEKWLLFIVTIHIDENDLKYLKKFKNYMEEKYNRKPEIDVICYMTVENNDLLFCIKSNQYIPAMNIINTFQKEKIDIDSEIEVDIKYTYTILGLSLDMNYRDNVEVDQLEQTEIDQVVISCVVRDYGKFLDLKSEIDRVLKPGQNLNNNIYQTLGNEDYELTYFNVKWENLVVLFKKNGALTIDREEYSQSVYAVQTEIKTNLRKLEDGNFTSGSSAVKKGSKIKKLIKILDKKYKIIEDLHIFRTEEQYKIFRHILNTLMQFERASFSNYIYEAIIDPLGKVISHNDLFADKENHVNEMIQSIERLIQVTSNTNQHFYQLPDYSMYSGDVPIKLSSFYSSYAKMVQKYLQFFSEEHQKGSSMQKNDYSFLVVPGIEDLEQTLVVFHKQQPGDRILIIKIPELLMYNFAAVCRIIVHEESHYIGGKMRNRRFRYKKLIEIFSIAGVYYIKFAREKEQSSEKKEIGDFIEDIQLAEKVEKNIKNIIEKEMENDDNYEKWNSELGFDNLQESLRYYLTVLDIGFKEIFIKLFDSNDDGRILNNLFVEYSRNNKTKMTNDSNKKWDYLYEYSEAKDRFFDKKVDFLEIADSLLTIVSECYADLSMVLTLDMTIIEYLETLSMNLKITNEHIITDSYISTGVYRMYYVIKVMMEKGWTHQQLIDYLEKHGDSDNTGISNLCIAWAFIEDRVENTNKYDNLGITMQQKCGEASQEQVKRQIQQKILEDPQIVAEYTEYLKECCKTYVVCRQGENSSIAYKKNFENIGVVIRDIYTKISEENEDIEVVLQKMQDIISETKYS